jgi:hypothetical protein
MEEDEFVILFFSLALGVVGMALNSVAGLHPLYFRHNAALGIVRLGVVLAMAWIAYVLLFHSDPSVTGIYVLFYLVMGYAFVKLFGQAMAGGFGFRTRVDAGERRNASAALVIAVFTVATGMIFGGSLWGEADAVGDDEGGWWIPVGFFLLGWATLAIAFALFQRRERRLFVRVRRERRVADARAAAAFLLAAAASLTDAVAGDFWGWRHGIFSFGLIAVLLLVHEGFAAWQQPRGPGDAERPMDARRAIESVVYLALGIGAWLGSRYVEATWGAG